MRRLAQARNPYSQIRGYGFRARAEPVIGRAFARPVGAPRNDVLCDYPPGKSVGSVDIADFPMSSPKIKIFLFYRNTNQPYIHAIPSQAKGRFANVKNAGRAAVDAGSATDEGAFLRTAKTCGPGMATHMPSRWRQFAGDGVNQARSPGRARYKP
jgi:hypothetical protein